MISADGVCDKEIERRVGAAAKVKGAMRKGGAGETRATEED